MIRNVLSVGFAASLMFCASTGANAQDNNDGINVVTPDQFQSDGSSGENTSGQGQAASQTGRQTGNSQNAPPNLILGAQGLLNSLADLDRPLSPEEITAYGAALQQQFPLTPALIRDYRRRLNANQAAAAAPPTGKRPTALTSTIRVALGTGGKTPEVYTSPGVVSVVSFFDRTGAPWPVASFVVGRDDAFQVYPMQEGSNQLAIAPLVTHGYSNLAVSLVEEDQPLVIDLQTDENRAHYRLDLSVNGLGPSAIIPTTAPKQPKMDASDDLMMAFVQGVDIPKNCGQAWYRRRRRRGVALRRQLLRPDQPDADFPAVAVDTCRSRRDQGLPSSPLSRRSDFARRPGYQSEDQPMSDRNTSSELISDAETASATNTEAATDDTATPDLSRGSNLVKRRKSSVSRLTTGIAVLALAATGGVLAYNFTAVSQGKASVMTKGPQTIDGTPAGDQLAASPAYQQTLYEANTQGASAALEKSGASFIAVPDEPVKDNPLPQTRIVQAPTLPVANTVAAAPAPAETKTETRIETKIIYRDRPQTTDWEGIKQLLGRMNQQADQISKGAMPQGSKLVVVVEQDLYQSPQGKPVGVKIGGGRKTPSLLPDGIAPLTSNFKADLMTTSPYFTGRLEREPILPVNPGTPLNANAETFNGNFYANAGDITFAVILNGSDTDTPGPVVAKLVKGPLKGARLLGSFAPNRETTAMIVQFDRVILPDGTNLETSAYALDSKDATLAVRSSYSGRYLERYGPKLAGAFVAGLGTALANTGTTVVGTNSATVITSREQTTKEALYAGAAGVGNQLASEISDLGPSGPVVRLSAGKLIGVLFTENVARVN